MLTPSAIGRILLGVALTAFGVENLLLAGFLPELQPVGAWLPHEVGYLNGALLIAGGLCLITDRRVELAARVLLGVLAVWVIAFFLPLLVANPKNGGAWTGGCEALAMAGALALLAFPTRPALGRVAFAITLPVFGLLHFIYLEYVASVIPGWLPGHVFWAYATGVAHIAAGVALLTGVRAHLAAILVAMMFGSWVVILHLPRVIAAATNHGEWTSLMVAVAMTGGGLLLVDRTPR